MHIALLDAGAEWADDDPLRAAYTRLRGWRDKVNAALEGFRAAKHKSLDARITLRPRDPDDFRALSDPSNDLAEWFIVSGAEVIDDPTGPEVTGRRARRQAVRAVLEVARAARRQARRRVPAVRGRATRSGDAVNLKTIPPAGRSS